MELEYVHWPLSLLNLRSQNRTDHILYNSTGFSSLPIKTASTGSLIEYYKVYSILQVYSLDIKQIVFLGPNEYLRMSIKNNYDEMV